MCILIINDVRLYNVQFKGCMNVMLYLLSLTYFGFRELSNDKIPKNGHQAKLVNRHIPEAQGSDVHRLSTYSLMKKKIEKCFCLFRFYTKINMFFFF